MAISSRIAFLVFGVCLLLSNVGAVPIEGVEVVEAANATSSAGCTATTFAEIATVVAACQVAVLQGITVPLGGQIALKGLHGKTIQFSGKTVFTPSPSGRSSSEPLIRISDSSGLKIIGMPGSEINGMGQEYWDGGGGNKGIQKPKFMRLEKLTDSSVVNLHVVNTPVHSFAISGCKMVTLDGIKLDNSMGDKPCAALTRTNRRADVGGGKSCGHNTDGFGVSGSTGIKIMNSRVDNQDDCLAVNSGQDITFMNNYCSGGHGVSIGSIKSGNSVTGVHISNTTIRNSENGVRIKTYDDATNAAVSDITYKDIRLEGITKYGIVIQQDYRNDGPTGRPGNVPVKGVNLEGIKGSVRGGQNVYVLCGAGSCTKWAWSNLNVVGGTMKKACVGAPTSAASYCR